MPQLFTCSQGHQWPPSETASQAGSPVACPVCGGPPTLDGLGVPAAVCIALGRLRDELLRVAGANLKGLLLYGGLARGRYHPGRSDINLVVLLADASARSLAAIAPALRAAWREARVEPLVLRPEEVGATTAAFATKFLDIKSYHIVLAGKDPFAGLEVPRELVRLRIEQALRNMLLRLRRRYLAISDDPASQALALVSVARPLALELEALLRLAGKQVPSVDRTAAIFDAAAQAFELDREALARLAELRAGAEPGADLADTYNRLLTTLGRAADVANQMKEASR
jgi:hypothetical protein